MRPVMRPTLCPRPLQVLTYTATLTLTVHLELITGVTSNVNHKGLCVP